MPSSRPAFLALLATFLTFVPVDAQDTRATLLGSVTDASGAVVPQARITARSMETNVETRAETNASGSYEIPFLIQGNYEIRA